MWPFDLMNVKSSVRPLGGGGGVSHLPLTAHFIFLIHALDTYLEHEEHRISPTGLVAASFTCCLRWQGYVITINTITVK